MSRPRAVALVSLLAVTAAAGQPISLLVAGDQDIRFRDRVDVESVVVDARVVDGAGRPILGLVPRDFRLKVDGHVVELQSVTWVAEDAPPDPEARAETNTSIRALTKSP